MVNLFNSALSMDHRQASNIMCGIEEYRKLCESCVSKLSSMREDCLFKLEMCQLTDDQMLETAKKIKEYSLRNRAYRNEISICKALKSCGFYTTNNEQEQLKRFYGAVNNTIRTLKRATYTQRVDSELANMSEEEFEKYIAIEISDK